MAVTLPAVSTSEDTPKTAASNAARAGRAIGELLAAAVAAVPLSLALLAGAHVVSNESPGSTSLWPWWVASLTVLAALLALARRAGVRAGVRLRALALARTLRRRLCRLEQSAGSATAGTRSHRARRRWRQVDPPHGSPRGACSPTGGYRHLSTIR